MNKQSTYDEYLTNLKKINVSESKKTKKVRENKEADGKKL